MPRFSRGKEEGKETSMLSQQYSRPEKSIASKVIKKEGKGKTTRKPRKIGGAYFSEKGLSQRKTVG